MMIAVQEPAVLHHPPSSEEIAQRVAILKRFKELLSQQRQRFRQYLELLDKQKQVIEQDNTEDLLVYTELEEHIVADIYTIQKVIDPLETMYQAGFSAPAIYGGTNGKTAAANFGAAGINAVSGEAHGLPGLRLALEELRAEAMLRSARNRELLSQRMAELRQEMKTLRSNPYAIHRSPYSQEGAALIDING